MERPVSPSELALVEVGRHLHDRGYRFTTVTPESHRRVLARDPSPARTLREVFGWNRPFERSLVPPAILDALGRADAVHEHRGLLVSKVRFSSLGDALYTHSAYPTLDEHAVFFGPDTYRFCALLGRTVERATRVVDLGCGSGAGGLVLADRVARITLADINPRALRLASVNAQLAGVADRVELCGGDLFAEVTGPVDLVIGNPPYLVDPGHRVYRDGGGALGIELGVRIVGEGLARLAPGGMLVLYTGAPVVDGVDRLRAAVAPLLERGASRWSYDELDVDVFGEELETAAYATVDRIAAVAVVART